MTMTKALANSCFQGGSLLFGQFPTIFKQPSGTPYREWIENVPNDGLIRYLHVFNAERILLTSPKALAEVLVQKNYEFVKPKLFSENLGRLLGLGILFAEGDEHKRQRKLLLPAFAFRHIKELYTTFWVKGAEVTEAMTKAIQQDPKDGEDPSIVSIHDWASRVTLDIIGIAGMGHDFNAVQDPDGELSVAYRNVFQASGAARFLQLLSFFLPNKLLTSLPIKRNRLILEARSTVRSTCFNLIEAKKIRSEKGGDTGKDIISVALESGGFTTEQLVDQLMTFLAAGHETTASAMAWAVYHLCSHPKIQARLREEIRGSLPSISDPSKQITASAIDDLTYLNAVCHEVLRLYPSVPLTIRVASEDATILGHLIPANTAVIVSPWAINASKELWGPDAHEFNPERWIGPGRANTGGADSNYSFLTFLHGPRSCIGQAFAKAEFACLLATWIGRFEMEFASGEYVLDITGGVTSKPKDMRIKLKVAEGW